MSFEERRFRWRMQPRNGYVTPSHTTDEMNNRIAAMTPTSMPTQPYYIDDPNYGSEQSSFGERMAEHWNQIDPIVAGYETMQRQIAQANEDWEYGGPRYPKAVMEYLTSPAAFILGGYGDLVNVPRSRLIPKKGYMEDYDATDSTVLSDKEMMRDADGNYVNYITSKEYQPLYFK